MEDLLYPNIERIFIFSKLKLRENPQLTLPTLQIQYCYSLIHSRKYLGQPYCLQTSAFGVGI